MPDIINLDANASYPMPPEIGDELAKLLAGVVGNPSSIHSAGQRAKHLIDEARDEISRLIDLPRGGTLVFTSGATESNNLALDCVTREAARDGEPAQLVHSAIEHPSIIAKARRLSALGYACVAVSAGPGGEFEPASFAAAVSGATTLVSVMLANNETGQLLPVQPIARSVKAKRSEVLVHSDAVQALGKVPVSFPALGVDLMSISGHKLGALTGVGGLVIGPDVEISPSILGGPQEGRLRGGTENVIGIASFGIAARIARRELGNRTAKLRALADRLFGKISETIPGVEANLFGRDRLPNTLSLRVRGVRSDDLVVALDLSGVLASSGAACASGKPEPSSVLVAMGLGEEGARETVRLSVHAGLGPEQIDRAAAVFSECVSRMRAKESRHLSGEEARP